MSDTKRPLCACGCGHRVPPARRPSRPPRWVYGHHMRAPAEERFWARVDKRGSDDCWLWTGSSLAQDGRGRFWFEGKNTVAPRVSLILAGVDVPDGAFVCHTCHVAACVNPNHLYVGDAQTNADDREARKASLGKGTE